MFQRTGRLVGAGQVRRLRALEIGHREHRHRGSVGDLGAGIALLLQIERGAELIGGDRRIEAVFKRVDFRRGRRRAVEPGHTGAEAGVGDIQPIEKIGDPAKRRFLLLGRQPQKAGAIGGAGDAGAKKGEVLGTEIGAAIADQLGVEIVDEIGIAQDVDEEADKDLLVLAGSAWKTVPRPERSASSLSTVVL